MKRASLCVVMVILSCGFALGQATEKVLYSFCSVPLCADGRNPNGPLAFDKLGNIYGTTRAGGTNNLGTVFELQKTNGVWNETVLYSFCANGIENCPDGSVPLAGVLVDGAGSLVGTTSTGGAYGLGAVFELSPPTGGQGAWSEALLWSFGGSGDGQVPKSGLTFDAAGNLYGTTFQDDIYSLGTVFRLSPPTSGLQWTENLLYVFGPDQYNGAGPESGVIFDKSGNLYGTTAGGGSHQGSGSGVVYELSPSTQLPWKETVLLRCYSGSGSYPQTGVNFDRLGNLYGTFTNTPNGFGGVFRLSTKGEYTLPFNGANGMTPQGGVFIHADSLYGTTEGGGAQEKGVLYQIRGLTQSVLYNFCSQPNCTDGANPTGSLVSAAGSFFGTTLYGGIGNAGGGGVVFEVTP